MSDRLTPLYSAQREAEAEQYWQELVNLIRRVFGLPIKVKASQRRQEAMERLGWPVS
jgi:hypothetical protein